MTLPASISFGPVTSTAWRVRLTALAAAGGFLVVALGIRVLAGRGGVLDSAGALPQYSGTALYAAMVYAGLAYFRW